MHVWLPNTRDGGFGPQQQEPLPGSRHRHRHCGLVKWSHPARLSQTCDARVSLRISGQPRPCDERD
eukprot:6809220-Prymnesium_polylepis.1